MTPFFPIVMMIISHDKCLGNTPRMVSTGTASDTLTARGDPCDLYNLVTVMAVLCLGLTVSVGAVFGNGEEDEVNVEDEENEVWDGDNQENEYLRNEVWDGDQEDEAHQEDEDFDEDHQEDEDFDEDFDEDVYEVYEDFDEESLLLIDVPHGSFVRLQ